MAARVLEKLRYFLAAGWNIIRKHPIPAVAGISVTDVCNLNCIHCWRKNEGKGHAPWDMVQMSLQKLYSMGSRYLYIQGGEPFTWYDGGKSLDDVVKAARGLGFYHVTVCTNGTFPLNINPHSFSVSLDGGETSHDFIRSGSYQRVIENIETSPHPNIIGNVTLNRANSSDLDFLAEFAASSKKLRGILVNFHIPYPGVEHLALPHSERMKVMAHAIQLKRCGYPILNTYAGLRALGRNDWKRPLDISVVTDCTSYFSCCRARGNEKICEQCGYAAWAEASMLYDWDVAAILEVMLRLHTRWI